jgi:hypothetical protein
VFSDSNGISFGMSGSSRVTASYTVPTVPFISAGTSSQNTGTIVLSDSGGHDFGMNGGTITVRHDPISYWQNTPDLNNNAIANGTLSVQRVIIPSPIAITRVDVGMSISGSASGAASLSLVIGFYSINVSTATLLSTMNRVLSYNSTSAQSYTNHSGAAWHSMGGGTVSLNQAEYLIAVVVASSSASTNSTLTLYGKSSIPTLRATTAGGAFSQYWNDGIFTVATSAMPNSFHLSDINQTANSAYRSPMVRLLGTF